MARDKAGMGAEVSTNKNPNQPPLWAYLTLILLLFLSCLGVWQLLEILTLV